MKRVEAKRSRGQPFTQMEGEGKRGLVGAGLRGEGGARVRAGCKVGVKQPLQLLYSRFDQRSKVVKEGAMRDGCRGARSIRRRGRRGGLAFDLHLIYT
jgi:hypothetical protein